ncbi:amino acid permease [Actinospica sp. MGRD01-02]|uniref:Amino acid permease n=1 Tax=Actinospica acidithermotolerans TaxID=2828514 RepID=A0A941IJA3_9ACTN|nr:amino acid permease [Actinospica acidithermotolerans]MBR7829229.1 amino acid permease [Actinospica acidithermotolerans]
MSTSTTGTAPEAATDASAQPSALSAAAVDIPESLGYRIKRTILGKPLVNDQLFGEKLSRPIALGVLAPDCISSSAYGTEQMLTQLIPVFGLAGFTLVMPITGVILVLLIVLTLCYRDVVSVYTKAGGSYVVAREQFGVKVAQVAAVALLIDYIVTVAVQIAAGTIAVSSWLSLTFNIDITSWSIWISVFMICLLCYGNLRGIREAGRTFAFPMYFYVTMIGLTVVAGLARLAVGDLPHANNFTDTRYGGALGTALDPGAGTHAILSFVAISGLLRAFANGGSSLTGLEAISNGVSAFRKPAGRNARKSMFWMSTMLGSLVLGVSILAWQTHATPYESGSPSVLGQLSSLIWGHGAFGNIMLTIVQLATALILYTGGNTSFNGFPFLASFVAEDSFLPRQFLHRGHRLAFSNGIIVLAIISTALLLFTGGNLTRLVSLYAIGVFTGFTMAAAGLFKYHRNRNEKNRTIKLVINGTACVLSAAVVVIFAIFKFTEGAWMVVVVFPVGVFALIKLNERYRREAAALAGAPASASVPTLTRSTVLVLVDSVDLAVVKALRYARSLRPVELRAVHLMIDSKHAEHLRRRWDASIAADVPLEVIEVPDRRLRRAAAELAARTHDETGTEVTIMLPRRAFHITSRLLHDHTADKIASAVSRLPHVAAMIVPFDVVEAIEEMSESSAEGNAGKVTRGGRAKPGHGAKAPHADQAVPVRRTKKMLLDAECVIEEDQPATGASTEHRPPIAVRDVRWRNRATLEGRIRSVYVGPVSGSPALEAELYDETGGITLVFLGRRAIPGIEPGAKVRVEGMVGETEGYLAMTNPSYRLLPREGEDEGEEEG